MKTDSPRIPAWLQRLAFVALVALSGCSRPAAPEPAVSAAPLPVHSVTTVRAREPRFQELAATVRPVDYAVIAARTPGSILQADFALGQNVAAGEVLITLEARELSAAAAAAQAALDQVAGDLARESALLAQGVAASEAVRVLADRHRAAAAALEEAAARLAYTRVTAPFDGRITRKMVNVGDLAAPGSPLFELEGRTGLRAECELPASLPVPALGSPISVRLVDGTTLNAPLLELSSAVDPATRTRLAKLQLPPDAGARFGDFIRVLWPAGLVDTLTLPAEALSPLGQMERVFVVTEDRAHLRLIKTAGPGLAPGSVRIAAGLEAGERVVLSPPHALRDGQPVELLP
jgi:RND family efflux transporter MFP subunit